MVSEEDITGYVVVWYPEGKMRQASIFFESEEREDAINFLRWLNKPGAELLARIKV